MTPTEIASALRVAAAELEEGREATAHHFVRKASEVLLERSAEGTRRKGAPRLRVAGKEAK